MTFGQLKEAIAKSTLPDDAEVFVELQARPGERWFKQVYHTNTVEDTGNMYSKPALQFNICYPKG